jgi:hypothetical protein
VRINGQEIDINIDINYDKNMHKLRENGLLLTDKQIEILKKYEINYLKYNNISNLIYEIEEILNEEYYDDLEQLSLELSEYNYYNNTNK